MLLNQTDQINTSINEALCSTGAAVAPLRSQSGLPGSRWSRGTASGAGCIIFSVDQPRNPSDPSVQEEKSREREQK